MLNILKRALLATKRLDCPLRSNLTGAIGSFRDDRGLFIRPQRSALSCFAKCGDITGCQGWAFHFPLRQLRKLSRGKATNPKVSALRALILQQVSDARRVRQYRRWVAQRAHG